MISRRGILRACIGTAGASLAGCLSGSPHGTASSTGTSPTSCSADDPPAPSNAATPPRSYPERPAELTTESVEDFLRAYEQAYQYNDALAANPDKIGRTNEFTVDVRSVSVTPRDDRFTAEVSGELQTDFLQSESATTPTTETETPLPAGHGPFEASYVVTVRRLSREGVVLECW